MKRLFTCIVALFFTLICFAQKEVTSFLGIPVDGTMSEMKRQLISKGFTASTLYDDMLIGEFNGVEVNIFITTNKGKVCRLMVADVETCNEASIKVRFNKLIQQFKNNEHYVWLDDYTISDAEDISYEMTVHSKLYDAAFFQKSKSGKMEDSLNRMVWFRIAEFRGEYYITMYYDNEHNMANGEDL